MPTITVKMEMRLSDFEEFAWGAGAYNLEVLIEKGLDKEVEFLINEVYPEGATNDEINDFLSYDEDTIARHCGFSNWDELEHGDDEEEEDEETTVPYEAGVTERQHDSFASFCAEFDCDHCPYRDTSCVTECERRFWERRDEI